MTQKHRFSLVACARWEEAYIQEWLVYHRFAGFDHFYLYSNDDGPAQLWDAIAPLEAASPGAITYRHWPEPGAQREMYLHFWETHAAETEWAMLLDIDEFLNLNGRRIRRVTEEFAGDADALYFNWVVFGHAGHVTRPAGSVLLNYTRRHPGVHPYTKNLVRTDRVPAGRLRLAGHCGFWHGWEHMIDKPELFPKLHTRNVLGDPMAPYYVDFPASGHAYLETRSAEILARPRIHHYSIKSEADFLLREQRGIAGAFLGQKRWADMYREGRHHHHLRVHDKVTDTSLSERWAKRIDRGTLPQLWRRAGRADDGA